MENNAENEQKASKFKNKFWLVMATFMTALQMNTSENKISNGNAFQTHRPAQTSQYTVIFITHSSLCLCASIVVSLHSKKRKPVQKFF